MTYITHHTDMAVIEFLVACVVALLVIGSVRTRQGRRRKLLARADAIIYSLFTLRNVDYKGTKHARFVFPVLNFEAPWTLYFDAKRQRFWLENPNPGDYDLPIVANVKGNFVLNEACVGDWLKRCRSIQAIVLPRPRPSRR